MRLTLLIVAVSLACSCIRSAADDCGQPNDCFEGETCVDSRCVPEAIPDAGNPGDSCDLAACESEWTDEVQCRGASCVVLSCADGADLCAGGCCQVVPPPDGKPFDGVDARLLDVETDPRGYPELMWLDVETVDLFSTRWTGRGWESERVTAAPEPSLAFDLEYDGDVRTITYLDTLDGALYHAREAPDGAWISTKVMDAPEPLEATPNARFFFRMHYAGTGESRVICALFGNTSAADDNSPDGEYPDLYVATWQVDHWESELFEETDSVRRTCSVAIDSFGQPHVAYSIVTGNLGYVQHAFNPLGGGWVRSSRDEMVGVVTTNEALKIQNNEPHIFVGALVPDSNDELVAAVIDYFRRTDGEWSEQQVTVLTDSRQTMGVGDVAAHDDRLEIVVVWLDESQTEILSGRVVSTQPRTWGSLEIFGDTGNIGDLAATASADRLHMFVQPATAIGQWNYFSAEAP